MFKAYVEVTMENDEVHWLDLETLGKMIPGIKQPKADEVYPISIVIHGEKAQKMSFRKSNMGYYWRRVPMGSERERVATSK